MESSRHRRFLGDAAAGYSAAIAGVSGSANGRSPSFSVESVSTVESSGNGACLCSSRLNPAQPGGAAGGAVKEREGWVRRHRQNDEPLPVYGARNFEDDVRVRVQPIDEAREREGIASKGGYVEQSLYDWMTDLPDGTRVRVVLLDAP